MVQNPLGPPPTARAPAQQIPAALPPVDAGKARAAIQTVLSDASALVAKGVLTPEQGAGVSEPLAAAVTSLSEKEPDLAGAARWVSTALDRLLGAVAANRPEDPAGVGPVVQKLNRLVPLLQNGTGTLAQQVGL